MAGLTHLGTPRRSPVAVRVGGCMCISTAPRALLAGNTIERSDASLALVARNISGQHQTMIDHDSESSMFSNIHEESSKLAMNFLYQLFRRLFAPIVIGSGAGRLRRGRLGFASGRSLKARSGRLLGCTSKARPATLSTRVSRSRIDNPWKIRPHSLRTRRFELATKRGQC